MSKTVDLWFDVGSPTAYLAWNHLPAIAARHGATIDARPMLLGAVHKATGNSPPFLVPAKGAFMVRDLERFARRYGVPITFNPHFPINTLRLMRGAAAAHMDGPEALARYAGHIFDGMWNKALNLGDETILAGWLGEGGYDMAWFEAVTADEAVKAHLKTLTDQAVARGVFGAPTMFVGEEMFFGQDRLDFVEEALAA